MSKHVVTAGISHISGTLRYGHYELLLDESEFLEFVNMTKEEKIEWIKSDGDILIDDFNINDIGDITDIEY